MTENLRKEVLKVFKLLHRTRKNVFHGDERALQSARKRINEEYRKYQHLQDITSISEKNRYAQEVEHELRTTVVKIIEKKSGVYEAQITKDTLKVDNAKLDTCCNKNTSKKTTDNLKQK